MSLFYEQLYTAEDTDLKIQDTFLAGLKPKLTPVQKTFCEGNLTRDELYHALQKLNNGKSPGSDGLPAEFYKKFWNDIADDLTEVFQEAFRMGNLTVSQREAVISCLPKKGHLKQLSNWRPVSHTDSDTD